MRLIDASVLVAAFSQEQGSSQALAWLLAEPAPVVNALGLTETKVSLIRKRKRQVLTSDEMTRAVGELDRAILRGHLHVVPTAEAVWPLAVHIADRSGVHLRTQDAVHVATAVLGGLQLATFDADLASAARGEGIDVWFQ
jgi:hypothetical protein